MYIFLNRSFIDKISVFPIYFLIKIFHDTCQTLATGDTYAVFVTSRVRTETRASSASVYVSSVVLASNTNSPVSMFMYAVCGNKTLHMFKISFFVLWSILDNMKNVHECRKLLFR